MAWPVAMPDLGRAGENGTVAEWLKATGDPVRRGEAVAIVETDKASLEIEAPADGRLLGITAAAGTAAPAGATLAWIGAPGEATYIGLQAGPAASVSRGITVADAGGPRTARLAQAALHALREVPRLNARLAGGEIRTEGPVDLAIAVETPSGLAWPVIHEAGRLDPATLAEAVAQCVAGVGEGWVRPGPTDATFALLDLGPAGVDAAAPVLVPPRLSTLATGALRRVAVETVTGIAFADRLTATLVVDHRLADEGVGARFLAAFAAALDASG